MRYLLDFIYILAILGYSPKLLYRRLVHGRYQGGWDERLGNIRRRDPQTPCIWIHAVSVGEVNAAATLVAALRRRLPQTPIAISATTDTGLARAKALYEKDCDVFYFPFDLSPVMRKAIDRINPSVIGLMELEVWPNLSRFAAEKQIPVVVLNGRISDRSFPQYQKLARFIRPMFGRLTLALAQTDTYAQRFVALGCPPDRVQVTGSLKYDTAHSDGAVPGAEALAEQINRGDEPLWVLGGTGDGEEQIGLEVFTTLRQERGLENLRLAIVPRKPERFEEVAELIDRAGLGFVRYSELKTSGQKVKGKPSVILCDTLGDLKKFYAISTLAFVGRSLVPMGGSDMMESAGLGKCTLFGPHTFNFSQSVEALLAANGAIEVKDKDELLSEVRRCLTEPEYAARIAAAGQAVIRAHQGATEKTIAAILRIIEDRDTVKSTSI